MLGISISTKAHGVPTWNKGTLNEVFIASRWDGGAHLDSVLVSPCGSETVLAQALCKYVGFKVHAGNIIYRTRHCPQQGQSSLADRLLAAGSQNEKEEGTAAAQSF